MSEWWSYGLRDLLMFSLQTYYRLFERYNAELWPAHVLVLALGVVPLVLCCRDRVSTRRWVLVILALAWLSVAWFYFRERYASINLAASYYARLFLVEALILAWLGAFRGPFILTGTSHWRRRLGLGIYLFALFAYPLIPIAMARNPMQAEVVGLAPDPTALATLGILLLTGGRSFWLPAAIPMLWCLGSGATLWAMQSPDFVIPLALALLAAVVASLGSTKRA